LEKKERFFIDNVKVRREINCEGCKEGYIPSNTEINITITAQLSHNVSATLSDIFPKEFSFISEGIPEPITPSHDRISWQVSGDKIEKSYALKSPGVFFTRSYIFKSQLNQFVSKPEKQVLYWFYKFLSIPKRYNSLPVSRFKSLRYHSVSPENPLVLSMNQTGLEEVAIFPNKTINSPWGYISKPSKREIKGYQTYYLGSSIKDSDTQSILVRFKVENSSYWNPIHNAEVLRFNPDEDSWTTLKTEKYDSDQEFLYYQAFSDKKGYFAIKTQTK
jgi:hypothetical protein